MREAWLAAKDARSSCRRIQRQMIWMKRRDLERTCVDCFSAAVDETLAHDSRERRQSESEESDDSDVDIAYVKEVSLRLIRDELATGQARPSPQSTDYRLIHY